MTGKDRTLAALSIQKPDRVPLYIHGINEVPIIGIGRHLTDGLPEPKQFHEMNDLEKMKLLDTLFLIHEEFGVDGFTSFEIGHEKEIDAGHVEDDWGVVYTRNPHGLPVPTGHPLESRLIIYCWASHSEMYSCYRSIPGTIALLIIIFLVKERASNTVREFRLFEGIKSVLNGDFSLLLVVVGIFSLGAFNFSFVLLNAGDAGIADSFIPLVYAVVNISHAAVAIPAGILSDRLGKEKVMILGYGVFLSSAILILLPISSVVALLVALVYGAYLGIVETVQRALIPDYVVQNLRGTAYGLYYLLIGSAFFVSNAVVGTLWEIFGSSVASTYSIILSVAAICAMLVFVTKKINKKVINNGK